MKTAHLLVNLGTPRAPTTKELAKFLRQFLMDKEVLDLPFIIRWILVHLIIIPIRSKMSAMKYKKIWAREGSPLLVNSQAFVTELAQEDLYLAMSYGAPGINSVVMDLVAKGYEKLRVVPLYPQYATSTTRSVENSILNVSDQFKSVEFLEPFYSDPNYLTSLIRSIEESSLQSGDHLLVSFHGIPVGHLQKLGIACTGNYESCRGMPCAQKTKICYMSQCHSNYTEIYKWAKEKNITCSMAYQSRVGKKQWLDPSSIYEVQRLAAAGVKNLKVVCPSFVVDCLETLEEINIELRQVFLTHGGKNFELIPCLNDRKYWVESFGKILASPDTQWKKLR